MLEAKKKKKKKKLSLLCCSHPPEPSPESPLMSRFLPPISSRQSRLLLSSSSKFPNFKQFPHFQVFVTATPHLHIPKFISVRDLQRNRTSKMYTDKLRVCSCARSCPTLCEPMDCSPPGSSVCGISRQDTGELPFPPPGDLPDPGIEP